jgi:hypothetical protein
VVSEKEQNALTHFKPLLYNELTSFYKEAHGLIQLEKVWKVWT